MKGTWSTASAGRPWVSATGDGIKQVKYIVEPGFYQVPNPLVMNLNTWNKLPKKFKDLLTEAAMEAENGPLPTLMSWPSRSGPSSSRKGCR